MEIERSQHHREFFERQDQQSEELIQRLRETRELYQQAQTFARPFSTKRRQRYEIAQRAVDSAGGNKSVAARGLGISRNTLRYWLGEN